MDYYFWGRIKDLVYVTPPTTRDDMMRRIEHANNNISEVEISRATNALPNRIISCITANGGHFEHIG